MQTFDVVIIGAGETGRFIADRMTAQNRKIRLIAHPGNHAFAGSDTLVIDGEEVKAKRFVIATGAKPKIPDAFKNKKFILPADVDFPNPLPASATIVGAGPTGARLAQRLASAGVPVRLQRKAERILPEEDEDIAAAVAALLQRTGVQIEPASDVSGREDVILATGLQADSAGLGLEKAGVYVDPDGRVAVDEAMRTSNSRIFAAGAVTGPPFHPAFEKYQAEMVADNLFAPFFARRRHFPECLARVAAFNPPFASIGLTEKEAREKSKHTKAVKKISAGGLIKLVADKRSGELLGAHLLMPGAGELILYFDLIMQAGISLRDAAQSSNAHESVQAWIREA